MPFIEKRWQIAPPLPVEAAQQLNSYPPLLRQILYNRGYTTSDSARQFLETQPPEGVDPFNLKDMQEAVDRLRHAILTREPIAIYGDYDADGVTATTLLVQVLRTLDADVQEYIPNRFEEGYGVNEDALTALHERGIKLVVTVDCGMRSAKETEHANKLGLDLIITDHHLPGEEIPRARAIINPKQLGDTYPYKISWCRSDTSSPMPSINPSTRPPQPGEAYLDLVAIGTVVDMADW
jgi:single-stranded-DNA-specific exonuclease